MVFEDNTGFQLTGSSRSGAITEDGSLYMWGSNSNGELGDGTTESKSKPVKVLDKIKLKNCLRDVKHLKSTDISRYTICKLGEMELSDITGNGNGQIASFINLTPNAVYYFYTIKDKHADNLLSVSNLLFIFQATADGNGRLSISYSPKENVSDADVFLVKAEQNDISSATVNIPDLEYNQRMQYAEPVVTYQDRVLSEWEDYELLGDYSAIDAGEYALTVRGIGEYKGLINAYYKIYEVRSRKIQKITLSVANVSLDSGKTLQLKAEILPEDAENKTLQWSSSDEKVAVVDSNGLVTAISEGNVTITVRSTDGSDISAACVITVKRNLDSTGEKVYGSYSAVKSMKVK